MTRLQRFLSSPICPCFHLAASVFLLQLLSLSGHLSYHFYYCPYQSTPLTTSTTVLIGALDLTLLLLSFSRQVNNPPGPTLSMTDLQLIQASPDQPAQFCDHSTLQTSQVDPATPGITPDQPIEATPNNSGCIPLVLRTEETGLRVVDTTRKQNKLNVYRKNRIIL